MAVSVTKAYGVRVLTVTTEDGDPLNCPLLGLLVCKLCPCSDGGAFKRGPSSQSRVQSALGALQIMIGVLNIGLFTIVYYRQPMDMDLCRFGVLFIIIGITSILAERFSCPCMILLSLILNLCGVAFALKTLISYSAYFTYQMGGLFYPSHSCMDRNSYFYRRQTTTPSPDLDIYREMCFESKEVEKMLMISIFSLLVTLSALELCVVISSFTLTVKAVKKRKSESKDAQEPEPETTSTEPILAKDTAPHT